MEIGNSGAESRVSLGLASKRIDSQCVGRAIVVGEKGSAIGPISRQLPTATQNAFVCDLACPFVMQAARLSICL